MSTLDVRACRAVALLCGLAGAVGCSAPDDARPNEEVLGEQVAQPIVNGAPATAYEEAALVNGPGFICSGAVIAPRVVLTAGHCVAGASSWTVTAPYAGQSAHGSASWTDYVQAGEYVNASTVDVAVIILDDPIALSSYPKLASAPSPSGTQAVNVGRIRNGRASYSGLFVGSPVTLQPGAPYGFPYDYRTSEVIEPGDSGGPVYVGSGASRSIVAVNSGAGGGTQVLARVDLVRAHIAQIIADHGGAGATDPPDEGDPDDADPDAPEPIACAEESEPNDSSPQANPLSSETASCGALATGADVDWYTWSLAGAGVAYDVSLATKGDADILMWKWTGSAWSRISNTSPTKVAATSNAGGTYVVAVRSAGGAAQPYTLSLAK